MAIFLIIAIILIGFYFSFIYYYKNKIYPGISVGNIDLSGLTDNQAANIINQKIDNINQNGIKFQYHNQETVFLPMIASVESDLAYRIVNFNVEESALKAMKIGRSDNIKNNILQIIKNYSKKTNLKIRCEINENEVNAFFDNNFSHFATPAKNAELIYEKKPYNKKALNFSVKKEEYGQILNYAKALKQLKNNLANLNDKNIEISANINYPKIFEKDCLNINAKANKIINRLPLKLAHENNKWDLNSNDILGLLTLKENKQKIIVGLNIATTSAYLEKYIAPKINIKPINAKFEIVNGKVKEFQISQDGLALDAKNSAYAIENILLNSTSSKANLIARKEKSELNTSEVNDFGITKIIGTGHSSFAGSPRNRRHNIKIGADSLNGVLVKPGNEFSLVKTLGKIDAKSGYLPELVIKENKTIPEYGGGLCQIGTTAFRATVESGLPVTMRRNHSYRVSYYEPAGTDATIYSPWPDYRFANDTKNHILIQSRIEGDDLYFDFWGADDGRIATHTYPVIYNIVKPGPTKIIETPDLKPGKKKCTEHAHNGADAYFDYTVTYSKTNPPAAVKKKQEAGEEINAEDYIITEKFKSHYVPWRAVCLVGIEENKTASSSDEIIK
ncbi:MAG: VanW family protein [Patescibacteria group bacterium]|nr:VanW family protein [Patescibacteria group bacterium]